MVQVNGDYFADAVIVLGNGSAAVVLNDGHDNFTGAAGSAIAWLPLPPMSSIVSAVLLDAFGDGHADVLTVVRTSDVVVLALYRWQSTTSQLVAQPKLASFAAQIGLGNITAAAAMDVNGDGLVDVVTATTAGCRVLFNSASNWSSPGSQFVAATACLNATCVAFGDVSRHRTWDGIGDVL